MSSLAERLLETRGQITQECTRLSRPEPTLIVVTKNHPMSLAQELYELGERDFGENRVQEALPKFIEFNQGQSRPEVNWHLIGQLQTNKVKQALEFASSLHSLDRQSLLDELIKRTNERTIPLEVFLQVNLTQDSNRGGVTGESLMSFAAQVAEVASLKLAGLMAVASLDGEPSRDFELVAKLSEQLTAEHPAANQLSIGMSGDFVEALSFGATHLRIGTAITGNRSI
jgi:pyridoxal phosphate enzyme (YggS family)